VKLIAACWYSAIALTSATGALSALAADDVVHPTKLALGADAFLSAATVRSTHSGTKGEVDVLDHEAFRAADDRFDAGVYAVSGPHRAEIAQDYGVDEFMYFLEGGVTLISADGTRTEVGAGEAVVVPKTWRGVWESEGYKKIYVIYSPDKPIE
jgi:uncharacterized cupin superfamily protein